MIVSYKRTRNLFDLTNMWKHSIISRQEAIAVEDIRDLSRETEFVVANDPTPGKTLMCWVFRPSISAR